MIAIIIMIGVVVILSLLLPPPNELYKLSGEDKSLEKKCPPHTWVYSSDGFLICSECRRTPGYTPRE